jgi:hypothetical protein
VFVGHAQMAGPAGDYQSVDVYLCGGKYPTGIVRFSGEPSDYQSKPLNLWGPMRMVLAQGVAQEVT